MLMLLSVHVTSILFLVQFSNFTLTLGFYILELHALILVARSYALLVGNYPLYVLCLLVSIIFFLWHETVSMVYVCLRDHSARSSQKSDSKTRAFQLASKMVC